MTELAIIWSILIAQIMIGLAMAFALYRMVKGPRAQDRILGLDTLYINAMLMLLSFGIRTANSLYFESALIVALIGSLGLLRLPDFYTRLHAPTLATSGGVILICTASIICFAVLQSRWVFHEVLIIVFVIMTTPVTLMLLGQAALYRDRVEQRRGVPLKQKPLPEESAE